MATLSLLDPEELRWRERISQEILGAAMALDVERGFHPKYSDGLMEAVRIAKEGL